MSEPCTICGAEATRLFGASTLLCDNPACEQAVLNEANFALDEAARTAWEAQMAREYPVANPLLD
jgi:hypothetical protein